MAPLSPYDLRTAAGRGPERFPAGHRWDDSSPKIRFAQDSPLEEAVRSELVSAVKFPVSRENTGNFFESRLRCPSTLAKRTIKLGH